MKNLIFFIITAAVAFGIIFPEATLAVTAPEPTPSATSSEGSYDEFYGPEDDDYDYDSDPYRFPNDYENDYHGQALRRPDSTDNSRNWWQLLKRGKLDTSDTTIVYPRFLNFCMKVYRWADHTFNSYDTDYVQGTGRRWKIRLLSDNWVDSYYINPGKKIPIRMMSDPYPNLGVYLQYMAVSLGYSVDLSNIIGKHSPHHKKFEYSFNCARFNVEGHYWNNKGGTYIRTFAGYNNGHLIKKGFDGVNLEDFGVYGYFFFNNRKFSYGAAYNFSKFQRKSAGSAVIGIGYSNINVDIDFNRLPKDLMPYLTIRPDRYKFHYQSFYLLSGYSFNWVITSKLLFNISAFPGIGLNSTYADSSSGQAHQIAMNIKGRSSLTYNMKDFFICAVAKIDGNWYISGSNAFFSAVENAQLSIGYRF